MNLEPNDAQTEMLTRELHSIVQNDRYPLGPSIVALKEVLGQLRPEPEREPLPPPDALPRATTIKGWQAGRYIEPFSR
jgi:hypothetical protein